MKSSFSKILFLAFLSITFLAACASGKQAAREQILLNPELDFWKAVAPAVFKARIQTTQGDFVIEAHRHWAPIGVDRFYNLVRAGFFDDSRFYRIRAGFITQFGLPGNPEITRIWKDRSMPDDPVQQSNKRGFVAYAMTGPDTRTTQLYINMADNSRLDAGGFAPIGRVVEGMAVVDSLYSGYDEDAGGGMRGGKQGKILQFGNAHLDKEFPKLDRLEKAFIMEAK